MTVVFSNKKNFAVLCNKLAIVCEGSGYPRNGTSVGVHVSALSASYYKMYDRSGSVLELYSKRLL